MARTFILDHAVSDYTDLLFDHKLVDAVGTAGSDSLAAAQGGGTANGSYTTDPGTPGFVGATPAGTWSVELNITGASSGVNISCRLVRRNSAGVFQSGSTFAADQSAGTTGVKSFSFPSPPLSTWASGDRFGVNVRITNTNAHGGEKTVTWETLTVNAEVQSAFPPPAVPDGRLDIAQAWLEIPDQPGGRVEIAQAWLELPDQPGGRVDIAQAWLDIPDVGGGPDGRLDVAQLWFEMPDQPAGRIDIAQAWLEIPDQPGGRLDVAQAWLEIPDAPGRLEIAQLWLQIPDVGGAPPAVGLAKWIGKRLMRSGGT